MTAVISSLGVFGVFLLMVPESACIPVPSEVTLLFSGFAVSQHWMSLPLAVLAATAGNLLGSLIAYGLGASRVLDSVPGVGALAARSEQLLERHGTRAVFFARLLPLARTFVSLPAGARRVPLLPFVALTTLGCCDLGRTVHRRRAAVRIGVAGRRLGSRQGAADRRSDLRGRRVHRPQALSSPLTPRRRSRASRR